MTHIKCEFCKYVQLDKSASGRSWAAYMCGNKDSDYYGALLNITHNGDKLNSVAWIGCACGALDNAAGFARPMPAAA